MRRLAAFLLLCFAPACDRDAVEVPDNTGAMYNVIDIGTLGGPEAEGLAIGGDYIVGWSRTATAASHAFRWRRGAGMIDLGTLGGASSIARDVNAAGIVVGEAGYSSSDSLLMHAFVYRNGAMTDLGTLGGRESRAYGINPDGTRIVGVADSIRSNCANPIVCSEFPIKAATLWVNNVPRPLAANTPNPYKEINMGTTGGVAYDISGDFVVGAHIGASVFWDQTGTAQMITAPFFTPFSPRTDRTSVAWRVTPDGTIIGWDLTTQQSSRTIEGWFVRGTTKFGLSQSPTDYQYFRPLGINASGDVVGESGSNLPQLVPSCECGAIWRDSRRYDLNLLVKTDLRITAAHAIDDKGNIVATGVTPDGFKRALLLEPIR